ncbi:MAG: fumarylacetoacetate hydrolase family protein [Anaerolineales bacterium]|nr:fumarylacetoacetate hydrolase family protein [Anaerolineales bacterium]
MRLVTYRDEAGTHVGARRGADGVVALDALALDMLALIDLGAEGLARAAQIAERAENARPLAAVQLLAPIPRPRQNIICVGLNYAAHAIEAAVARGRAPKLPEVPVFFTKAAGAVCGPEAEIPLDPRVTSQLDYEVELAFVIGPGGRDISAAQAMRHVYGYTIVNDISARDLQNRHQQYFKGKSLDRSCPMGPCLVTADEIPAPGALGLRLRVNGEIRQDSVVSDLIFKPAALIESLSLGMTLEPGTIISTGTPSGVALGMTPPRYLQPGDVIEAEIDQIGVLRNRIVAA